MDGDAADTSSSSPSFEETLLSLGIALSDTPYRFYAPTPETHAKVLARLVDERKKLVALDHLRQRKSARSRSREPRSTIPKSIPEEAELVTSSARGAQPSWERSPSVEGRSKVEEAQAEHEAGGSHASEQAVEIWKNKLALRADSLVELFGWSMPLEVGRAEPVLAGLSAQVDVTRLETCEPALLSRVIGAMLLPRVRFSNLYLPSTSNVVLPGAAIKSSTNTTAREQITKARQSILYAHSAFPTTSPNSVFFGPDSYRFLQFLTQALAALPSPHSDGQWKLGVDVGVGPGAGALALAGLGASEGAAAPAEADGFLVDAVLGTDINPLALRFAQVNASLYHRASPLSKSKNEPWSSRIAFRESSLLQGLTQDEKSKLDLVISNPPYIAFGDAGSADETQQRGRGATYGEWTRLEMPRPTKIGRIDSHPPSPFYSADGGRLGIALPIQILLDALDLLPTGGLCLLYTGVPISLSGLNPLQEACQTVEAEGKGRLEYWQVLDVDVFGDELRDARGPYGSSDVGRIEVVGVGVRKI